MDQKNGTGETVDMDKGAAASGADAFDVATGTSMSWEGKRPEELAALPESELESMSSEDIERAFGLDIPDRSRQAHPTGSLTVDQAERAIEAGEASVPTEEMLAAAALAVISPQAKESEGSPTPAADQDPSPAKTEAEVGAGETATETETSDGKPVVSTRDGKGVIPYDVLEASRRREAELRAQLAEARGEANRKEDQDKLLAGLLTDEQIEEMRSEFPDAMVDAIVSQQNTLKELAKRVAERPGSEDTTPEEKAAQSVQDLIDQDPILSGWQNDPDQANWTRAVRFDDMLREDPEWSKRPIEERFSEVRRLMGAPTSAVETSPGVKDKAEQAASAAAKAEAAAIAAASGRAPTHSDLPGGAAPAQSEQSRLEALTPTQLEAMLENGVEVDALLAKFG